MGDVVDNETGPSPVHEGTAFKGWQYQINKRTPCKHEASPFMTRAQLDDVLAEANGTEQQWLDEHPPAVKTWLQTVPSATARLRFQENCQKY